MLAPRMGGAEPLLLLRDAEIRPLKQLRRQDDLGALGSRLPDEADGLVDVRLHVLAVGGLDGGDGDLTGHQAGSCWLMQWNEPPPDRMAVDGRGMISRSVKTVA